MKRLFSFFRHFFEEVGGLWGGMFVVRVDAAPFTKKCFEEANDTRTSLCLPLLKAANGAYLYSSIFQYRRDGFLFTV